MALQLSVQFPSGLRLADAYHRVEAFEIKRNWVPNEPAPNDPDEVGEPGWPTEVQPTLHMVVRTYHDATAINVFVENEYDVTFQRIDSVTMGDCYAALKALPQFAGAVDV